jgi:hypothetical protein
LLAVAAEAIVKFKKPFPHTVIDNFIDAETVAQINREWPAEWLKEDGKGQRKWSTTQLPPAARAVADSIDVAMVEQFTGIAGLFIDNELFGAGLHCIPRDVQRRSMALYFYTREPPAQAAHTTIYKKAA